MNKETFLAMSLPHKLRVYVKYSHSPDNSELETLYGIVDGRIITNQFEEDIAPLPISNYGVVLHPLSDLTKLIEHKGKTIHVLSYLCEKYRHIKPDMLLHAITSGIIDLNIAFELVEFHFDIAGLIEKGQAIDVNTLEVNPYK